jgi:hypothetical protein
VKTTVKDFPSRKNSMIDAMLQINDLYLMSKTKTASVFFDDVREWLDTSKIYYSQNVLLKGISNVEFSIDFLFQRNGNRPETMLQTIGEPSVPSISRAIVMNMELEPIRHGKMSVMVNDGKTTSSKMDEILALANAHGINAMQWSKRNDLKTAFA